MFDVGEYRFKAYAKPHVLRMSPYIRTNEKEEDSAFAMLLLYVPWPAEGEANLLRGWNSAVEAFAALKDSGLLPGHVLTQIACSQRSEELLNDIGEVTYTKKNERNENEAEDSDEESSSNNSGDIDDVMDLVTDDETGAPCVSNETSGEDVDITEIASEVVNNAQTSDVQVITQRQNNYYSQYIANQTATYLNNYMEQNCSSSSSMSSNTHNNSRDNHSSSSAGRVPLQNERERREALQQRVERLTEDQRRAYDSMSKVITSDEGWEEETAIQFITGGAGVGKSEVLKCIIEMTRLHFGKCPGLYGSVLIMGPTGAAAHHINGFTWQSVCLKGKDEKYKKNQSRYLSQSKAEKLYNHIKGVKWIVLDEISMIALEGVAEISTRFCEAICTSIADARWRAKIRSLPFAGIPTTFCGDLYQLSCVGGTPVYTNTKLNASAAKGHRIWRQIKLYHNLITSTRFSGGSNEDASLLERFLRGTRTGNPNNHYIDILNAQQLCVSYMDAYKKCDPNALWLASTHHEKDPINKFMYERLKVSNAYTMDVVAQHSRNDCPHEQMTKKEKETYYAKSGDKLAPILLRLAIGSRVKITENLGTQIGMNCMLI